MVRYLVTGGAGFIGANIAKALLNKGEQVRILDNYTTGKRENVPQNDDIERFEGDFTDDETVKKAVKNVDVILHQGAIPSVPRSVENPLASNHANVTGTLKLLNAAVEERVSRFVYAASSSAYGNSEVLPKHEENLAQPLSPYAVSKYVGEHYCKVFHEIYGLETISLRYFNVFGPGQDPNSQYAAVIPKFIHMMLRDESPIIYGDGTQSRDFTFIDNVVDANLSAATAPKLSGEVVNIGSGERIEINRLVQKINKILNKNVMATHSDERRGDVKHSLADIQLAEQLIGYRPKISFASGLTRTIASLKE